ncbi:MAG: hypothetical protein M3Q95_06890 [Bacteroidota bacterium]|nr:hypothetical protein [Bacteroidota bacterium]
MNQLPDKNNDPLRKLIHKNQLEQPSIQFTASVMDKLGIAPVSVTRYEPVISRKGWIIITLITITFFYLALAGSENATAGVNTVRLHEALQQTTSVLSTILSGSFALLLSLASLAVFILFGVESWYRQTRLRTV